MTSEISIPNFAIKGAAGENSPPLAADPTSALAQGSEKCEDAVAVLEFEGDCPAEMSPAEGFRFEVGCIEVAVPVIAKLLADVALTLGKKIGKSALNWLAI